MLYSCFDFEKGNYISDYIANLQKKKNLPSEFHVKYTPENEKTIYSIITKRYKEWKPGKKWWKF